MYNTVCTSFWNNYLRDGRDVTVFLLQYLSQSWSKANVLMAWSSKSLPVIVSSFCALMSLIASEFLRYIKHIFIFRNCFVKLTKYTSFCFCTFCFLSLVWCFIFWSHQYSFTLFSKSICHQVDSIPDFKAQASLRDMYCIIVLIRLVASLTIPRAVIHKAAAIFRQGR